MQKLNYRIILNPAPDQKQLLDKMLESYSVIYNIGVSYCRFDEFIKLELLQVKVTAAINKYYPEVYNDPDFIKYICEEVDSKYRPKFFESTISMPAFGLTLDKKSQVRIYPGININAQYPSDKIRSGERTAIISRIDDQYILDLTVGITDNSYKQLYKSSYSTGKINSLEDYEKNHQ